MQETTLPQEISYNRVRLRGFYTKFTEWPVYPNSSNQYWNNDEIVRFQIDLKQRGTVCDPYRSHIEFTVSVNEQQYPVGGAQIDSSAQNFFSQSVISSNSVEIERIAEYDTLATILTDLGFSEYVCENRSGEGLGYSNIPTHVPASTNKLSQSQINFLQVSPDSSDVQPAMCSVTEGLILPFNSPIIGPVGYTLGDTLVPFQDYLGVSGTHVTSLNPIWNVNGLNTISARTGTGTLSEVFNMNHRFGTVRSEYLEGLEGKTYPDSNQSILPVNVRIANQKYQYENMRTVGYDKSSPYNIEYSDKFNTWNSINAKGQLNVIPNNCGTMGYLNPICGEFAKGTMEPFLSPTVPQVGIQNGLILPKRIPLKQKTFRVPLISAIFGVLIPPDQFTLIPLESLNNLILELTLSRYGMFTSGYSDCHELDKIGMDNPQRRQWLLSNFSWNLHLYSFNDVNVVEMIETSMVKQIALTSYGYALSSSYQITNGQNVKGEYNIAAQYESLCEVYCVFLSNEYQNYPFCRKQFRLSNNVTQLQFRINTDFYPIQPITGNAGNPETLDTTGDNWNFYEQVLLSNNFLFNTNHPSPKINTKNFCINNRAYNVRNQKPLYDPEMYNNPNYVMKPDTFNFDTAMGMSKFHENRYVGKALFCYSWEPYGHSKQYLNGLNTSGTRNFQVIFNTLPQSHFQTDETLYIFSKYNQVTVYGKDGILVYGK